MLDIVIADTSCLVLLEKIGQLDLLKSCYDHILDDLKARKVATSLNLKITGTLGIIVKAKEKGVIPSVSPILDQLHETDFRVSQVILDKIKEIAGE